MPADDNYNHKIFSSSEEKVSLTWKVNSLTNLTFFDWQKIEKKSIQLTPYTYVHFITQHRKPIAYTRFKDRVVSTIVSFQQSSKKEVDDTPTDDSEVETPQTIYLGMGAGRLHHGDANSMKLISATFVSLAVGQGPLPLGPPGRVSFSFQKRNQLNQFLE